MRMWRTLAVALAAGLAGAPAGLAQPARSPFTPADDAPSCKYAVTPQAGEWLLCVQTFKDDKESNVSAQALAEDFAELIRRNYRLPAYLFERGRKERVEEDARIEMIHKQYNEMFKQMRAQGLKPVNGAFKYRVPENTVQVEVAVLVGKPNKNLKDMEAARDFVDDVRKLKAPPERFCKRAFVGLEDPKAQKITQTGFTYINPFSAPMVVRNPSLASVRKAEDPDKADEFLKELNSGEKYSVFKASKPWTLVVKVYQGPAMLAPRSPSVMSKLGLGKKEPEYLNAGAQNAHVVAECLRSMKPSYKAFVMHHRTYSLVTVGEFDGKDDPELLAVQRTIAGLQLKDQKSGAVLESLNAQPMPMKIPR